MICLPPVHLDIISHIVFLKHLNAIPSIVNIKTAAGSPLLIGKCPRLWSSTHKSLHNLASSLLQIYIPPPPYCIPHDPVGIAYCSPNVAYSFKILYLGSWYSFCLKSSLPLQSLGNFPSSLKTQLRVNILCELSQGKLVSFLLHTGSVHASNTNTRTNHCFVAICFIVLTHTPIDCALSQSLVLALKT